MANPKGSIKHLAISKANTQVVIIAGVAGFVTALCLVIAQAYISQNAYLSKVTERKEAANQQLQANLAAVSELTKSYDAFQNKKINVIDGQADGKGQNDGPNSKIVLDALPSSYDFPALTSSIEKILTDRQLTVDAISGTDEEIVQKEVASSPTPVPVPMAFSFIISDANYEKVQDVISALSRSIRPIQIDSLTISGGGDEMELEVSAHTFFQPPKNLTIKTEAVQP